MNAIVGMLQRLIEENIEGQILHGGGRIQPVVVGPPDDVLQELYAVMTRGDTSDWTLQIPEGMSIGVAVLLVTEPANLLGSSATSKISQNGCGWGYVVSVRGSAATCVILATAAAWNTIPISVRMATKPILAPPDEQPEDVTAAEPWSRMLKRVADSCGVQLTPLKHSFRKMYSALGRLSADEARSSRWDMANSLLSATSADDVQRALGLLCSSSQTGPSWRDSWDTLYALRDLIKSNALTLDETRHRLHEAAASLPTERVPKREEPLDTAIDELFDYLGRVASTALEYINAPECYMRTAAQEGFWWMTLTASCLQGLLDSVGGRSSATPVELIVVNGIVPLPPQDWCIRNVQVVQREVSLEVRGKEGQLPPAAVVSVKAAPKGRRSSRILQDGQTTSDGSVLFTDAIPGSETGCMVYSTSGPDISTVRQQVVAIDRLECGGLAFVEMAESCELPARDSSSQDFVQRVTVQRAGDVAIRVAMRTDADAVAVRIPDREDARLSRLSGSLTEELVVSVEQGTELTISVLGTQGGGAQTRREWRIVFSIGDDDVNRPKSRTQQLIWQNTSDKKTPVLTKDCRLRALEDAALRNDASWLPVTIAITSAGLVREKLPSWDSNPVWGDIRVSPVCPAYGEFKPPTEYLNTRSEIRRMLTQARRPIGEVDLGSHDARALCVRYLEAYMRWLREDPEHATWVDLFMLHLPVDVEGPVGRPQGTEEPRAILMSPLHPLRLGWHSEAQFALSQAIENSNRCPGAGMLDCHALPSMLTLLTGSPGEARVPSYFVNVNIDDDYWAAFISCQNMGESRLIERLAPYFEALGIGLSGYAGGFGTDQTRRALDDLVEIYPARTIYRVGIVGVPESDSKCVKGVADWCRDRFAAINSRAISAIVEPGTTAGGGPEIRGALLTDAARCDVYDFRGSTTYPSSTELSSLAEGSNERVHWYRKQQYGDEGLDLLILDQASRLEPRSISGEAGIGLASVLSTKGLLRIDLRRSLGNEGMIQESSAIAGAKSRLDSALRSSHEAFAAAHESAQSVRGIRYKAYLDPLRYGLEHGALVAANAGDLDLPSAIGTAHDEKAYVWDFRLPGLLGEGGSSEGYYLMTKIRSAASLAMKQAAEALYRDMPPVDGSYLLDLLSRRGVPIIRQLGQNRNQAKGALGILLASQLLRPIDVASSRTWPLPLMSDGCLNLLLPMDPIWASFEQLARSPTLGSYSKSHADLLLVSLMADGDKYRIQMTPIEVKVRTNEPDTGFLKSALEQAENVTNIAEKLWASELPNDLWSECAEGLLARCLEFGFRLYEESGLLDTRSDDMPSQLDWSQMELGILQAVLEKRTRVGFPCRGIVAAFGWSKETASVTMGQSPTPNVLLVGSDDASALLTGGELHPEARTLARAMIAPLLANAVGEGHDREVLGRMPVLVVTGVPSESVGLAQPTSNGPDAVKQPSQQELGETSTSAELPPVTVDFLVQATTTTVPPVGPSLIPQSVRDSVNSAMIGFIGNENAISRVKNDLMLALVQEPPHLPKNYLFVGLPSTGKTELCRRIAAAVKLPFVALDGHGVGDRERLFDLVDGQLVQDYGPGGGKVPLGVESGLAAVEYPPCVVMIDEVHLLSRPVQESLLKALEISDRSMTLKERVVHLKNMTFLFATTRPSVLDKAFKSRCTVIELLAYSESQVAQIVHDRVAPELEGHGLAPWTEGIYARLARLGGVVPRKSLELAKELQTEIVVSDVGGLSLEEHLDAVQRRMGIDDNGLGQLHIKYLRILQKRGTCGFGSIIGQLDTVDEGTILDEVEPRLLTLGLIEKTPQGRQITTAGLLYLSRFDGTASS